MREIPDIDPEWVDTGLLDSLTRLARRGAFAALSGDDGGGLLRVYAEKGGRLEPGPVLPRPHLVMGLGAGLLAGDDGRFRLSETGRQVVRHAHAARSVRRAATPAGPAVAMGMPALSGQQINVAESPLAWLRRRTDKDGRPFLGPEQFAAGERLRSDLWRARMTPRVTASWSPIAPARGQPRTTPGSVEIADSALAARERASRALTAAGAEYVDLLIDVLGHLKGLEEVERSLGLPPRSGKRLLQQGLTALARHYGLLPCTDVEAHVRRRMQHWGTPDYRPSSRAE